MGTRNRETKTYKSRINSPAKVDRIGYGYRYGSWYGYSPVPEMFGDTWYFQTSMLRVLGVTRHSSTLMYPAMGHGTLP